MTTSPPIIGLHPFSDARAPLEFWGERAADGAVLIQPEAAEFRADAPLLGHVIDGRYAVYDARVLPNSVVYFAAHMHLENDRHVVIKRVRPDHPQLELASRRLRHEARFLARLPKHRHLPQLYDLIQVDSVYHLVMERAPGQPLDAILRATGTLSPTNAVAIMTQVLDGLAVCHSAGVVHRDLKPSNIMVARTAEGPRVTLIDFGIAKDVAQAVTDLGTRLQPGTPAYMSPEQAWNGTVTPKSDLYSATAVLHRMLLGKAPARDEDTSALTLPPETPPAWVPLFETGLALFADGRFQDAEHFKKALETTTASMGQASQSPLLVTDTGTEQSHVGETRAIAPPPSNRRPLLVALALLAAGVIWWAWPAETSDLKRQADRTAKVSGLTVDASPRDAHVVDAAMQDGAVRDAAARDAELPDATPRDAAPMDAHRPDVTAPASTAPVTIARPATARPRRARAKRTRKTIAPAAIRLADRIRSKHVARCDCGPAYGAALKTLATMQGGAALIEARKLKSCVHLFSPDLQICVKGRPVMRERP